MSVYRVLLGFVVLAAQWMAVAKSPGPHAGDVAAYDAILAAVQPDQATIVLGDMIVPVETVRLWRDQLAGTARGEQRVADRDQQMDRRQRVLRLQCERDRRRTGSVPRCRARVGGVCEHPFHRRTSRSRTTSW